MLWEPGAELIAELDPEGRIISCNRDAHLGRPDTARWLAEHLPGDQWERMRHSLRKVALTGTPDRVEINIATPAGLSTWSSRLVPHMRNGTLDSIILISTDMSPGEEMANALRESEERFRSVVDGSADGLLVEQDGRPVFANTALARLLGYRDTNEILSWPRSRMMVSARDRERFCTASRRVRDSGAPFEVNEFTGLRRDEEEVPLTIRSRPLRWNGKPAILHSVTRQQLEPARRPEPPRPNDMREALAETVEAVARTIEKRDPYTAGHHERVAELAAVIARQLGLDDERVGGLRLAAAIHDIGKVHVPAEILTRPGPLSAPEFEIIKAHPQVGYDIIKQVSFPWPVAETILQHHERMDGSGYPRGLQGDAICLEARILAVADCVDAMTSHRPYRPSLPPSRALQEIREGAGTLFDSTVVEAALQVFGDGVYPLPVADRAVNA